MPNVHQIYGYDVVATLGYGARSTIYAVRDKNHQMFALKRVVKSSPSDQRFVDQALREHDIASQFDHPLLRRSLRLIRHRNFIRTAEILVVMEMVDGLALEQHQPKGLRALCDVCRQAADGLAVMHEAGYAHADIKPNNIMVAEGRAVKIIDFGQSCPLGTVKERIQGTPDYIAPEQVYRRSITAATDVFNLAATMYWLLTKRHVPTVMPRSEKDVGMPRRSSEPRFEPPAHLNPRVPPALNSLIIDSLESDPLRRPQTMEEVSHRLTIARDQVSREREQRREQRDREDREADLANRSGTS